MWLIWLLYEICLEVGWPVRSFDASIVVGLGAWTAWRLYCRPRKRMTFLFLFLCLVCLWKFWLGGILFRMHPDFGGYSLSGAFAHWWKVSTERAILVVPCLFSPVFTAVSIVYWPIYCWERKAKMTVPAA